jgi:hypothetical protein
MDATHLSSKDIVDRLNADELRARLDNLDAEREALIILLRAARARERAEARHRDLAARARQGRGVAQ